MTRKKSSTKEKQKKIFDEKGKLIINKTKDEQINETGKQEPITQVNEKASLTSDEKQEKKREYWRKYYHNHKEKYKQLNKNWREKTQKSKE
jgi:hypothetical protein